MKPKLPQQFKAAEQGGIPFGIILGEDEMAAGKAKIKEMGLPEGHPEKEGVLVELGSLVDDLKKRIGSKQARSGAGTGLGTGVSEVAQQMESVNV